MRNTEVTETILFSLLFLFFLQSLSDFIEAIYAFGLLVTALTVEVASIILFFTPLLLLFFRKTPPGRFLLGLALTAILARVLEPMLAPGGKLVACGISVGAFMLLFPLLLYRPRPIHGWNIASGLAIAVSLSIFFRTANSSLDLSESGIFQIIGWLLGIFAIILFWQRESSTEDDLPTGRIASDARTTGLAVGLAAVILMIYFAFASPTVIARWTGFSYPAIVITLVTTIAVFGFLLGSEHFSVFLTRRVIVVWNSLFITTLVLTILPHQIAFPSNRGAYPLDMPVAPSWTGIFLFLLLVLSPILFINFMSFARQISLEKPSLGQLGRSFSVAALLVLLIVFFHVFTTVYDYVPVVGPFFRDRFWFVYFLAGLGMALPTLLLRKELFPSGMPDAAQPFAPLVLGTLSLFSLIALFLTSSRPMAPSHSTPVKVMTYNIQQGFNKEGNKNVEGQLAVIKQVNPDILGLQESDTARVANGNVDVVRYFADHLDMYSYYGPTTTTGTFGIALLSKYPIQKPITFFMYSKGEQTATIHAEIIKDGTNYQVFATHLGNGGPIFQAEDILGRIQGLNNVIAMGDFNFRPTTDQYAAMTKALADSWLLQWPHGKEAPGFSSERRIDYIFVSPGTTVLESEYRVSPASDHPYLYTVIQP